MLTGRVRRGRQTDVIRSTFHAAFTDERRLDAVEQLVTLAQDAGLSMPHLAMAFINAFFSGTYELRFARSDSDTELRTYKIASAPGEPVVGNFTHCLDHLAIESKRLRSCASTKGSPLPEGGGSGLSLTTGQGGQPIAHPRQGRTWADHT